MIEILINYHNFNDNYINHNFNDNYINHSELISKILKIKKF